MKPLSLSLLFGACALALIVEGLPSELSRFKRQTSSESSTSEPETPSSSSTTTTTAQPESSTSSTPPPRPRPPQNNNAFGIGATASIGGVSRTVGIGNFNPDTKSDAFQPWGAFAGLNLGNGGRIGAGCSGLSCGVQLGQLVLATPQLLGIGRNFLQPIRENNNAPNRPEAKKSPELTESETSETNFTPGSNGNPDDFRLIFRDAFRGFRETLASFFRGPVTHFIKKDRATQIDNSTESVVGPVKPATAASEQKTYRIQLTPLRPTTETTEDKNERENELASNFPEGDVVDQGQANGFLKTVRKFMEEQLARYEKSRKEVEQQSETSFADFARFRDQLFGNSENGTDDSLPGFSDFFSQQKSEENLNDEMSEGIKPIPFASGSDKAPDTPDDMKSDKAE